MKTSLIIEDRLYKAAQHEALNSQKTVSEVISAWAQLGRKMWSAQAKTNQGKKFVAADLGQPFVDLSSRKNWMEDLDNDRT